MRTSTSSISSALRSSALASLLASLGIALSSTACGFGRPCPEGVYEGSLTVEDDEYFVSDGIGGQYSIGRVQAEAAPFGSGVRPDGDLAYVSAENGALTA